MSEIEEIDKAIGVHGAWKTRLKTAINAGQVEFDIARARVDYNCDFGKWLNNLSPKMKSSELYLEIKKLHADFHIEVANILTLITKGQKAEAEKAMGVLSDFATISASLTMKMMAWKKTFKG